MALGFFRRRQKMVIIIMVVLMLSFLLGSYGVSTLMQTNPNKRVWGESRYGAITRGNVIGAEGDISVLRALGMGRNVYRARQWPLEAAFLQLLQSGTDRDTADCYALLLQEANAAGVVVTEHDIDRFFAQLGYGDEGNYKGLISSLRAGREGWTEQGIRAGVASWLKIYKYYEDVSVQGCAPSSTDLRVAFRDTTEEINLRVVRLKADEYLKDVPDPNQQAIVKQFKTYQNVMPGQNAGPEEYGFGYHQPGRGRIAYLLVRGDAVARVTQPSFNTLVDYYNQNKSEFYREVPIDANAPASEPADANTPTRRVPLSFAEAKQQIIDRLMDATVRTRIDELTSTVQKNISAPANRGADPNSIYEVVASQMTRPAKDILAKELTGLKIENTTVEDAVARLASAANIPGICFPWGTHGKHTLDKTVKVTLTADKMTLRAALDEICRQVKFPRLEWARCETFGNALFSVSSSGLGIDFFPLKAGQTDLMSYRDFVDNPIFGHCYASPTGQGQTLAQAVFSAPELSRVKNPAVSISVGQEGTPMYLVEDYPGRLLWRLVEAVASHVPASLTPRVEKEVIDDLKTLAAMKVAEKEATTIQKGAETLGLKVTAERKGLKSFTTGLFARRPQDMPMGWNQVPNLDEIDSQTMSAYFMSKAFKLAPKDVDANTENAPAAIETVKIPAAREILVLQRVGFKPALKSDYESYGKLLAAQALMSQRQFLARTYWFNCRNVKQRTDYQPSRNG